jgi:Na+/H+ antiporter NhaD/arsenite permease-like protein
MIMLVTAFRMVVGLFVDDGSLALAIIVIVLLSSIVSNLMPNMPFAAGAVLLVGSLGVLFANVMKAAQR